MIALETIRSIFIWHCLHFDPDPATPKWQTFLRILIVFGYPINFISGIAASARYCYTHIETEEALFTLFPIIYAIYLTYSYIALLSLRRNITFIFNEFQDIYDQCKYERYLNIIFSEFQ